MCGRYTLTQPLPFVEEHFQLRTLAPTVLELYAPRYNIAPGQPVLAVVEAPGGRRAGWLRWGFIPSWAKDPAIGYRMINARSETVAEKPAFRRAFRARRCLLPADGFYEWQAVGGKKQPYRFRLRSVPLFALAGLWETWTPPDGGEAIVSCTVLTVAANEVVGEVHHRMPAMLAPDQYGAWLDPEADVPTLQSLLRPYPAEEMESYPVSPEVNSAKNDHPGLIEPLKAKGSGD